MTYAPDIHIPLVPWTPDQCRTFCKGMYTVAHERMVHHCGQSPFTTCATCGVVTQLLAGPNRCQPCEQALQDHRRAA